MTSSIMAHAIEIRCSIQLSYERTGQKLPHFIGFTNETDLPPSGTMKERRGIKEYRVPCIGTHIPVKSPGMCS